MDTMIIDLAPKVPKKSYGGEGGLYEAWSPDNLPMLCVASIGAAKLLLHSCGFSAPSYSDSSKVAYVLQGN
jgi:Cupin